MSWTANMHKGKLLIIRGYSRQAWLPWLSCLIGLSLSCSFRFEYDTSTKKAVCRFKFNQEDYIGLPSYPSSREALTSHLIFKHSNIQDVIRAYQQGTLKVREIEEELIREYAKFNDTAIQSEKGEELA